MKIQNLLRALRHRNYKLFFSGQLVSLIGTWMQSLAMGWLVYRLSNSAFMLGLIGFSSQIPTFFISPFAGVFLDRWDKHKTIVITQTLSMVQAFMAAYLVLSGGVQVWHLVLLNVFIGLVNGFDIPARQSFIVEMIEDRKDLGNAIALNSSMFNAARLIGPSIAGLVIAAVGEGTCFLLNAVSYLAVIISLLAMRINYVKHSHEGKHVLAGLKEGIKYAWRFIPIRTILFMIAMLSLAGMPYTILMPVFAREILKGGAHTLGFLVGAIGVGALCGALYLASRKTVRGLGKIISSAAVLFGVSLIIFSFSHNLIFSLVMLVVTGMSMMIHMASCNTILQTIVDDKMRGRVMSYYTMAFMGMTPFGSLIFGGLASMIGAPHTLIFGGGFCLIAGTIFAYKLPMFKTLIRPVYRQKGIIPEIAEGIQSTTILRTPPEN
ncbi:MAG: MFS transporter [Ignavibacteriaceae bacterium]|nr:MFS transporter [Ignavibacteriaceae bacterium]